MLRQSIGNIFIDRDTIHEQCNQHTGKYEAATDILSRPPLPGSNYTELNSHSFFFDDDIIRPLVDMDKLWSITDADSESSQGRLVMYMMRPATFTPLHEDWMQTYNKGLDAEQIKRRRRWWIPVNDWIPGHMLQHEDYTVAHYKSGDVFPLGFQGKHVGVNASLTNRYYITFSALAKE